MNMINHSVVIIEILTPYRLKTTGHCPNTVIPLKLFLPFLQTLINKLILLLFLNLIHFYELTLDAISSIRRLHFFTYHR